jgi:chromosome segregation ATPase
LQKTQERMAGMSERDAYVQKLKAQLDGWNAEIDKLEAEARQAGGDAQLQYEQQLKSLRQQREDAKTQLAGLQAATGDAWEQLRKGVDEAWSDLKSGLEKASSALKQRGSS